MGVFRFRIFGFPVQVQPSFWALALLFGYLSSQSVRGALLWLGAFFLSILTHELGHAFLARRYGQQPVVFLQLFGGVASWRQGSSVSRWGQVWILMAGPAAGFLLGFASAGWLVSLGVKTLTAEMLESEPGLQLFLAQLTMVNFFYSAVNLLPILPLDGGQAMAVLFGPERRRVAATVSLVVGLLLAAVFLRFNHVPFAILCGFSGVSSYLNARHAVARPELPEEALREILARAQALQERGSYGEALAVAMAVFENAPSDSWKVRALNVAGWSAVLAERPAEARAVLARAPVGQALDAFLDASIRELDGDLEGAAMVLSTARRQGDQRAELVGSLIRVWLKLHDYKQACALAASSVDSLSEEDVRRVGSETLAAGIFESAAQLFESLFRQSSAAEDALAAARGWVRGGRTEQAAELLEEAVKSELLNWNQVRSEPELSTLAPSDA